MPRVDGIIWAEMHKERPIFLVLLVLGGLVGMPCLVATFLLSKKMHKRQPVFINFCVSWILYSAVYVLLGHTGRPINRAMCYIQTAFILGAPPCTALSTTLVIFRIWWTFRTAQKGEHRSRPRWVNILSQLLLLGSPYFVFISYTLISIGLQIKYPGTFDERNGLYCTAYGVNQRQWLVPIFCVICVAFMLLFQSLLIIRYFKNKKKLMRNFPLLDKGTSRSLVIRVGFFNLYLLVSFGMGVEFIYGGDTSWPYMVQAGLPLVCFLSFGTQRDVLIAWKILRNPSSNTQSGGGGNPSTSSTTQRPLEPAGDFPLETYRSKSIHIDINQLASESYNSDSPYKVYDGSGVAPNTFPERRVTRGEKVIPLALPSHVYDIRR